MRTPKEIYDRLLWSESQQQFDLDKIVIGYMDRFTGIQEISFFDFQELSGDDETLCIPWHRIWYFALISPDNNPNDKKMLWDRKNKFDIFNQ